MSSYLDVPSLKAYLRIANTDTLDDVLLAEIVDAVERMQRARLRTDTFVEPTVTASPDAAVPLRVTVVVVGRVGPFTFAWGDGTPDTTDVVGDHTYLGGGDYTLTVSEGTWTMDVPLLVPLAAPITVVDATAVSVPEDVYLAALQRGARLYARRASPEGLVPFGDLGVARIPSYDKDIEALEAPWRNVVLA